MRILIISIAVFLLFLSCNENRPIIETSIKEIYLDSFSVSDSKQFNYTIYNKGGAPLIIEKFACSCECTTPNIKSNQQVAPFDSLVTTMTISPKVTDIGKALSVLCTFRTNADSIFTRLVIHYFVKSA